MGLCFELNQNSSVCGFVRDCEFVFMSLIVETSFMFVDLCSCLCL